MNKKTISYIAHEASIAAFERQLKRQWLALIVAIVALIASNVVWFQRADGKDNHSCCACDTEYDTALPQSITTEVCYDFKTKAGNRIP